tara:strand:- start:129997 stop:131361 length:1365 start_codon:yes stop_codon:yes gene_type:complete
VTPLDTALNLLVVDDEQIILDSVDLMLQAPWKARGITKQCNIPKDESFHAALIDIHLSGELDEFEGLDLIADLHKQNPTMEIIAISGDQSREVMEKCLEAGATRFLEKPLREKEVLMTLEKVEALVLLQNARQRGQWKSGGWIGESPFSQSLRRTIAELRSEPGPILIEGETGTGKEVVAQMFFEQTPHHPIVKVNAAAIPEHLFDSEFFGHTKGAFTGAHNNKIGFAEAAHGGTLFIDEIEALHPNHQAKLLRFLESGEIQKVGSTQTTTVHVRVIAATNCSLQKMVDSGEFRDDLLWRISGHKIELLPLRERLEDMSFLVDHFLSLHPDRQKTLEPDALQVLKLHRWPGNVRELKKVIDQAVSRAPLPIIRAKDLDPLIDSGKTWKLLTKSTSSVDNYSVGLTQLVQQFEKQVIEDCLNSYQDIGKTGEVLQVSRSNLYKKIKDHNIEWSKQ